MSDTSLKLSANASRLLELERKYCAGGFEPSPLFLERVQGCKLWDCDGKEYIDFIGMFSATNMGHGHPYMKKKMLEQLEKAHLLNICAHNAGWGPFGEMMCKRFGYDKITTATSGTESADVACKIARKHGLVRRKIPADKLKILGVGSSYHGLGMGIWGLMDRSAQRSSYGLDGTSVLNFNPTTNRALEYLDLEAMRACLEEHHQTVAAVIMECLHGTSRSNEVRQGAGKTGKLLSFHHCGDDMKPDIVTMGKSITGGWYPQTFILGTKDAMSLVGSNECGYTFSHTPPALVAATSALEVIDNENLLERATQIGAKWRAIVSSWNHPKIDYISSIGADSNMFFHDLHGQRVAVLCMFKGLFVNATPGKKAIRLSFAMTMTDEELEKGAAILKEALDTIDTFGYIPGEVFSQD
ncbi:Ornithine aminotransferase [Fusarium keratoplasticum]|uniref:Ornithine aminotransferase n=1 Tax=Fusarium keratoplasticum TaxID=1328300 RepID=A0ACC0QBU7_9HYPO|nr:Ornithine aminotransferase [Fusarium keratoplasticum]KAI8648227.1 Ornithine aminotransferase [Fusarium keratoplasticum]